MLTHFNMPETVKRGAAGLIRAPWRFTRIIPGFDPERDEFNSHLIDRLRDAIKLLRIAGMERSWHYDPHRYLALREAYLAARLIMLRERAAMREAA